MELISFWGFVQFYDVDGIFSLIEMFVIDGDVYNVYTCWCDFIRLYRILQWFWALVFLEDGLDGSLGWWKCLGKKSRVLCHISNCFLKLPFWSEDFVFVWYLCDLWKAAKRVVLIIPLFLVLVNRFLIFKLLWFIDKVLIHFYKLFRLLCFLWIIENVCFPLFSVSHWF